MHILKLLGCLRTRDGQIASSNERSSLAHEAARSTGIDEATRTALTDQRGIELGLCLASGDRVLTASAKALGHWGIWGPSGAGKSYALVSMLGRFLDGQVRSVWVLDPKGETVELMARSILDRARRLPKHEADTLLSRVVLIEPFSDALLPPLQVLKRDPAVDPELQAWAMATLVTAAAGSDVGVRQETILHRSIECLIRADLPLTILPLVLAEPRLLSALSPDKVFNETTLLLAREKRDRLQGIAARVERLLRLRSTRLMLGGSRNCLDFGALMKDHIVLVNLAPPFGSADVGRFVAGLLWQRVTQAILSRPNGSPPAVVAIDEWPEFLAGGSSDAAAVCERLLRLARSKGVSMMLLSQDVASVQSVSGALPQVIRTNLHWHLVFRTTEDWRFAIRPTGRRLPTKGAPWDTRERGYLSRSEEEKVIADELANLPDRTAYLVSRRYGLAPVLVRTEDLTLAPASADALAKRIVAPTVLVPASALEQHAARMDAHLQSLLHGPLGTATALGTTANPRTRTTATKAPAAKPLDPSTNPQVTPAATANLSVGPDGEAQPPPAASAPKKRNRRVPIDLG